MRRRIALISFVLISIAALALAARHVGAQAQPAAGQGDVPLEPYPGPANPLDLVATGDDAKRVKAIIGPAGGVLKTTGADGAAYELTIPPKALREEVEIAMRPIATLNGLVDTPVQGMGVILEPDGLVLDGIAMLRITKPGLKAHPDAFAIAGYGTGYDSRMTLFKIDGDVTSIPVGHFTIYRDWTREPGAGVRRTLISIVPRGQGDRLHHGIAAHYGRSTDALVRHLDAYTRWMVAGQLRTQRPEVACPLMRQSYAAYSQAVRAARSLGIPASDIPNMPPLPDWVAEYMIDKCRPEAEAYCRANMDASRISDEYRAESAAAGGGPDVSGWDAVSSLAYKWAQDAIKRCLPSELMIRTVGEGVFTDLGRCKQHIKFDVEIRIRLGMSHLTTLPIPKMEGQGAHIVHLYEHSLSLCHCKKGEDSIRPISAASNDPANARVGLYGPRGAKKFLLELDTGSLMERWHISTVPCGGGSIDVGGNIWWRGNFRAHYQSRLDGNRISFQLTPEGGVAADTFQGSGTWSEHGTWHGTERTTIRLNRAP